MARRNIIRDAPPWCPVPQRLAIVMAACASSSEPAGHRRHRRRAAGTGGTAAGTGGTATGGTTAGTGGAAHGSAARRRDRRHDAGHRRHLGRNGRDRRARHGGSAGATGGTLGTGGGAARVASDYPYCNYGAVPSATPPAAWNDNPTLTPIGLNPYGKPAITVAGRLHPDQRGGAGNVAGPAGDAAVDPGAHQRRPEVRDRLLVHPLAVLVDGRHRQPLHGLPVRRTRACRTIRTRAAIRAGRARIPTSRRPASP